MGNASKHSQLNPQLEVINLSFTHIGKSKPTIADINFEVYPGEVILIAGATGSGKSTLLNCIAGISPEHIGGKLNGQILYQGNEINQQSIRERSQNFCILLQNVETQIFTDRVWEELVFGLENWNIDTKEIPLLAETSLQEFGLDLQRNWHINQLSAGQKQRLLLGCMLATGQPVLLLDEPFAFLDTKGVELLTQILNSRRDRGQSVILIEHRFDVVKEICNRIFRFQDGKLSEWDIPGVADWEDENRLSSNQNYFRDRSYHVSTDLITHTSPVPNNLQQTSNAIVLQTQNLSWGGYPAYPNLQVNSGETVLLKGDNGCGKTTLLKLLSGLLKPATGKLEVLGRDVTKRSVVQIAKNVGFVLQNPNHQLFADSVQSEIFQPGVTPEVGSSLIEKLNLSLLIEQHPHSLSQGQKRRLALGAVLARQPQICLLDEIMVGQDPKSLALMLDVLKNFTGNGGTLIFTSHDPSVVDVLKARVIPL
ncbi:ABC transporter ATP-binding protein [Mastigocoleus testarum]|uniref:ABC transporter ATP-binding protein n=1 Tax=Mastigocoleus testarum BC008 TaxID=371196 RepID=A0A0V7ZYA4_9CYAN|nr:ABC transporter ATP-binding protein [Mastigocoleus testarum]KST69390.1 ABC transporter ATP-binding protein [Mastigocoleus testarum BC008]